MKISVNIQCGNDSSESVIKSLDWGKFRRLTFMIILFGKKGVHKLNSPFNMYIYKPFNPFSTGSKAQMKNGNRIQCFKGTMSRVHE